MFRTGVGLVKFYMDFYKGDLVISKDSLKKEGNWTHEILAVSHTIKSGKYILFSRPILSKLKLLINVVP